MIRARIATLEAPGKVVFRSEDIDAGQLAHDAVLCESLVTAISPGTELAAYRGARPLRPGAAYPRLVGYCNVARVVRAGSQVRGMSPGDRVLSFTSHRSHFGIDAADVLAVIPAAVRSEDAACAYLFHLGYNAVLRAGVRLGSAVVVLGLGVLGLGSVRMASLAGARVCGLSDNDRARDCARSLGAAACFSRAERSRLLEQLGATGAGAVITTSDSWEDWGLALECAGQQATIAVLGFPGRSATSIPLNPLDSSHFYARQLRIVAAGMSPERNDTRGFLPFNERANLRSILSWIEQGVVQPALLVSGEFPGEALAEAYDNLARRSGSAFTYLLRWAS